jgi:hypothetical protein
MKQINMAIGFTLLFIIFTSLPYGRADHEPRGVAVPWVNPDGSKGVAVMSAASNRTPGWANPDGTEGIVERHSGPPPAFEYAWVNPNGFRSASITALNGVDHSGSANLTTNQTDFAQDNTQQFHEVTKGDGPMSRLALLGMLVAGSMLLLARTLWQH